MDKISIIFNYKGTKTIMHCTSLEKFKNICERFASKAQEDISKIFFLYNGNLIKEDLNFKEQANEIDKLSNTMNIIVYEINKTIVKEKYIYSEEIVCPECLDKI